MAIFHTIETKDWPEPIPRSTAKYAVSLATDDLTREDAAWKKETSLDSRFIGETYIMPKKYPGVSPKYQVWPKKDGFKIKQFGPWGRDSTVAAIISATEDAYSDALQQDSLDVDPAISQSEYLQAMDWVFDKYEMDGWETEIDDEFGTLRGYHVVAEEWSHYGKKGIMVGSAPRNPEDGKIEEVVIESAEHNLHSGKRLHNVLSETSDSLVDRWGRIDIPETAPQNYVQQFRDRVQQALNRVQGDDKIAVETFGELVSQAEGAALTDPDGDRVVYDDADALEDVYTLLDEDADVELYQTEKTELGGRSLVTIEIDVLGDGLQTIDEALGKEDIASSPHIRTYYADLAMEDVE